MYPLTLNKHLFNAYNGKVYTEYILSHTKTIIPLKGSLRYQMHCQILGKTRNQVMSSLALLGVESFHNFRNTANANQSGFLKNKNPQEKREDKQKAGQFKLTNFYFMWMSACLHIHVSASHACLVPEESRRQSRSPELESIIAMSKDVQAGNQTWVLCKSKCSQPLSHLYSLTSHNFLKML